MTHSVGLRALRQAKRLSRARLAKLSKVSVRTIQRMEDPSLEHRTPHSNTLERLAKALEVEPEALAGEAPLLSADDARPPEPRRVQMGVEVPPKVKLAYDLIKRRYGVNATEIASVAPLLFTLMAEQSLSRRREQLEEARQAIGRLDRMGDENEHSIFSEATIVAMNAETAEDESIARADIFGEHLLSSSYDINFGSEPFDPQVTNPFAAYLRQLANSLDRREIVETTDDLRYGSTQHKFPNYNICAEELDDLANGSADARRALEVGYVRLSEIPEELNGKDRGEERAEWLEERLPDFYKNLVEGQPMAELAKIQATVTPKEHRDILDSALKRLAEKNEDAQ